MESAYSETSNLIPTFFVLFAGVDPTPWVESLGKTKGVTFENGNFISGKVKVTADTDSIEFGFRRDLAKIAAYLSV